MTFNASLIKIDLDRVTPCKWAKWCAKTPALLDLAGVVPREWEVRKSPNGGVHVRIWLDEPLDALAVVALQAVLRSDPAREALNLGRVRSGHAANVLHVNRDGEPWGEEWTAGRLSLTKAFAENRGPDDTPPLLRRGGT